MSAANRRQADRLPYEVPVAIDTRGGPVEGKTLDVSRTGARLQFPMVAVGCDPSMDLGATAALITDLVPTPFTARLHHKMLGPLLERLVHMTRLAVLVESPEWIEFGCRFEVPLTIEEATTLGVPLPPVVGSQEEFCPRADVPAPHYRRAAAPAPVPQRKPAPTLEPAQAEPEEQEVSAEAAAATRATPMFGGSMKQRYRAVLTGRTGGTTSPTMCTTDQLNRDGVRLRLPRAGYESDDAARATVRFTEKFGATLGLKLVDGPEHLWTGPARVCCVEVPSSRREELLVTLAFDRKLRPAELRRMGIQSDVA